MGLHLVWFRNDLRMTDNPALWHGVEAGAAVGIFLISPEQWRSHHMAGCRADFLLRSLVRLRVALKKRGIPLVVKQVQTFADAPGTLRQFCQQYDVSAVYWNDEYPLDEQRRDAAVEKALRGQGVKVSRYHDRVICPPGSILKEDGNAYQVFTPFKKRWRAHLEQGVPDLLPVPGKQSGITVDEGEIPESLEGFESHIDVSLWPAGEQEAQKRLEDFVEGAIERYHRERDFPAIHGTSALSPYLAVGSISPQQCLAQAMTLMGDEGAAVWVDELIWRDFYQHIVYFYPHVCKNRAFKPETEEVPWRWCDEDFNAWCQGKTGIPLVDAGMRQLLECGWMHNRVRMVVAMFLAKNLLIDWRKGEAWFMEHLIDGDFPANNGGWQWSASTGTDAVPYFRIFNPLTQGERFDPEGRYIKRFVPELEGVIPKSLHHPSRLAREKPDNYPELIVDLKASREQAIAAFKGAKV